MDKVELPIVGVNENATVIGAIGPEGAQFHFCKPDGSTTFLNNKGEVMLELRDDGFYVRGERIDDPDDVYRAFSKWIAGLFSTDIQDTVDLRTK